MWRGCFCSSGGCRGWGCVGRRQGLHCVTHGQLANGHTTGQSRATSRSLWCLCENTFKAKSARQVEEKGTEEWETTEVAPRSEEQEERSCSVAEQIPRRQPGEDTVPQQVGVPERSCSPWRACAGAEERCEKGWAAERNCCALIIVTIIAPFPIPAASFGAGAEKSGGKEGRGAWEREKERSRCNVCLYVPVTWICN